MPESLVELTDQGLYCRAGDFYVDPWGAVDRAVITHAHGDHAHPECARYLAAAPGRGVLALRVGLDADIQTLAYGEKLVHHGVTLSLHPAGHILGSAQVRIEHKGEVWVVSGDYKLGTDPTCAPFEPVRCHCMITESTFGLPIYRWAPTPEVIGDVARWWQGNAEAKKPSLLLCYALGKAQRILAGLTAETGPIHVHGMIERYSQAYRAAGVRLAESTPVVTTKRGADFSRALILAPPSAFSTPWARRFRQPVSGFASGWMRVRGQRRRRAIDRGFVLSDHADWPELLTAIAESQAQRVLVTHGYAPALSQYLRERGLDARVLATHFVGEGGGEEGLPAPEKDGPEDMSEEAGSEEREPEDMAGEIVAPSPAPRARRRSS